MTSDEAVAAESGVVLLAGDFPLRPPSAAEHREILELGLDPDSGEARIGYRVARWTRGQGAATHAVNAVADWASQQRALRRILLTHAVENTASCRVAEKGGFRLERLLPANKVFGDGLVHDEHLHVREL